MGKFQELSVRTHGKGNWRITSYTKLLSLATKLQTEKSQPLWIQGQNSNRKLPFIQDTQEAQKDDRRFVQRN